MSKVLSLLLVLVVGLPSVASAVQPSGTLVVVPDSAAEGGAGPASRSWLVGNIFVVRAHVCRATGVVVCGPDPLVPASTAFGGVIRIWVPSNDTYTIYALVSDAEGNLVDLKSGPQTINGGTYLNVLSAFAPLPDGLYKFHTVVIGNVTGLVTFSDFYQFRIGGPSSTGCCP